MLTTTNLSTAVLFRVIERHRPTLLIDEGDAYLKDNEDLRGILNGGHNRLTAFVLRCEGDNYEPKRFNVWAPKAIALIGELSGTLQDRAIVVPLRRKKPGEFVERIRIDRMDIFTPLRRQAARWAADNEIILSKQDPTVPHLPSDRAMDNWRPLLAVADVIGGHWPQKARQAALALSGTVDDDCSKGTRLLSDCRRLFSDVRRDRWTPSVLVDALYALEEAPWTEWRGGQPITTRGIANLLKGYGIKSRRDHDGRYYRPSDFEDAFSRYLSPSPGVSGVTSVAALKYMDNSVSLASPEGQSVTHIEAEKPRENKCVTLVTQDNGGFGEEHTKRLGSDCQSDSK
jgi:putative DNA primase/helicase